MMPRMLIVEDERKIGDCLSDFFSRRGFAVKRAVTGQEAIRRVRYDPPDVILLDIRLPDLEGIEVLKRAKELHPRARVVMVTSLDYEEKRVEAEAYGACGYITKPFDFSETTWAPVLSGEP